jgi:hypothetical protein
VREMPDAFRCDACAEVQSLDVLCTQTHTEVTALCLRCCCCETHTQEIDGTVVYPWRGLTDSEHRTRRHQ